MSDNHAIERTRRMYEEKRFVPRNGKVFFRQPDRTRGFIFEAEMAKDLLRMRPLKESHTYIEFETFDDLLRAGWIVE